MSDESVATAPAVLVDQPSPGVRVITLNRPARLNSMTMALVQGLHAALSDAALDRRCRVVILTGAGRGFCSGADLNGEGEQPGAEAHDTVQAGMVIQEAYAGLIPRMRAMPQVVIAAVNGPAIGGGLAIALGADIRIAAESAKFAVAMIRIGLTGSDMGISYLLPRYAGASRAHELMLTGRMFDVHEAERIGLLSAVVPDGQALPAALDKAAQVMDNSPLGVRLTKQAMWASLECGSMQAAIELENRNQILAIRTEDSVEAVQAYFVEKRPPRWRER